MRSKRSILNREHDENHQATACAVISVAAGPSQSLDLQAIAQAPAAADTGGSQDRTGGARVAHGRMPQTLAKFEIPDVHRARIPVQGMTDDDLLRRRQRPQRAAQEARIFDRRTGAGFRRTAGKARPPLQRLALPLTKVAIKRAKEVDDELKRERFRGPLQGIPFGAKDLLAFAGHPTTWGAKPYATQVFDESATVLQKAG